MRNRESVNKHALCLLIVLMMWGQSTISAQVAESSGRHQAEPSPAIQLQAKPALWKVKGTHGTVFPFGTIHVMKKDVVWETEKIKEALKSSDVLYL